MSKKYYAAKSFSIGQRAFAAGDEVTDVRPSQLRDMLKARLITDDVHEPRRLLSEESQRQAAEAKARQREERDRLAAKDDNSKAGEGEGTDDIEPVAGLLADIPDFPPNAVEPLSKAKIATLEDLKTFVSADDSKTPEKRLEEIPGIGAPTAAKIVAACISFEEQPENQE